MDHVEIAVTSGNRQIVDITSEVAAFVEGKGSGFVNVFLPHATAGIAVMELGSGSEPDLLVAIERFWPRDDRYVHRHGARGHGADHVLPAFISPSLTVPVQEGRLLLGVWQSIAIVDTNGDNPRRAVHVSFLTDGSSNQS